MDIATDAVQQILYENSFNIFSLQIMYNRLQATPGDMTENNDAYYSVYTEGTGDTGSVRLESTVGNGGLRCTRHSWQHDSTAQVPR